MVNQRIQIRQASHVSVYFFDLKSGLYFDLNEKYLYDPASLMKMVTMIALFKKAESDPRILSQMILYQGENKSFLKQNFLPKQELQVGKIYSMEELVERMIIFSDNQASDLISQNLDNSLIEKTLTDLGMNFLDKVTTNTNMSVEEYAALFKILFNSSYLNPQTSEKALNILTKTAYQDGLIAGVPEDIKIAHKFGERSWDIISTKQLHDCGIIYYPDNPYLLCVMTRGNDFIKLSQVIKDISSLTYQQINKQLNKQKNLK